MLKIRMYFDSSVLETARFRLSFPETARFDLSVLETARFRLSFPETARFDLSKLETARFRLSFLETARFSSVVSRNGPVFFSRFQKRPGFLLSFPETARFSFVVSRNGRLPPVVSRGGPRSDSRVRPTWFM